MYKFRYLSLVIFTLLMVSEVKGQDAQGQLFALTSIGTFPITCPQELYLGPDQLAIATYQCPGQYYYWTSVRYRVASESSIGLTLVYDLTTYRDCAVAPEGTFERANLYPTEFIRIGQSLVLPGHYCQGKYCGLDGVFDPSAQFFVAPETPAAIEVRPGVFEPREACELPEKYQAMILDVD
ncbi:hypothetical protein [Pseudobacteriovorax antillogorgiicola]|uniref:Uncharacterized protein n=1 Tax=Pseudobacteriovorax antillogorgiicola TaxID=1513793 RepID=A0A1Y6CJW7_9BACT|nr:hypothetical protein [Pseudobacteriovorax antillogorgiicola]TCS45893.1 hypothetical protein EDD56_12656 [Pseudobacteriovorax antillogorgiicola]SMF71165.1 hypothetical protein SAMN06296036_12642 [Pseudobacteriovorax antillogorgiicola]